MKAKLQAWRTPLDILIDKISTQFTAFFDQMGCAGEVALDIPEDNALDIENYGITIYVKFRQSNALRALNAQVQSGGERSVATMLYLLSLQEQCPVPFRCVDEINQGMDPYNERRVFDMMVKLLSRGGNLAKTQYFL